MALVRLTLTAPADEVEALAALLEAHGAGSVALLAASEEPVFEDPGLWAETRIEAVFEDQERAEAAAESLVLAAGPFPDWELTSVPERDWAVVWKEGLAPRCFGGRLWVHPSWSAPDDLAGLRLVIDPGLAFGTGQHPTTALCLEWLALAGGITDCEALDYGCGSEILALAALRLGARPSPWTAMKRPWPSRAKTPPTTVSPRASSPLRQTTSGPGAWISSWRTSSSNRSSISRRASPISWGAAPGS